MLNYIPLGGIVFQFSGIVVYMFLTSEFLIRYHLDKPFPDRKNTYIGKMAVLDSKTKQMMFGVYFSSFCVFIRYFLSPPSSSKTVGWLNLLIA